MKIKELSNLLNVSQKTIRYYEGCGFIMPLTQNKSGRIFRDYDEAAITQLKTIIGLRKLRFSIDEIVEIDGWDAVNKRLLFSQVYEKEVE